MGPCMVAPSLTRTRRPPADPRDARSRRPRAHVGAAAQRARVGGDDRVARLRARAPPGAQALARPRLRHRAARCGDGGTTRGGRGGAAAGAVAAAGDGTRA
eukprot:1606452-Prymnesium_polylepis.1